MDGVVKRAGRGRVVHPSPRAPTKKPSPGPASTAPRFPHEKASLLPRFFVLAPDPCLAGSGFCRAQELRPWRPDKAPPIIPPPRAEPVVPPSPAKSIATQLNDAYVSVFERVAPAVVVIDVTKKPSPSTATAIATCSPTSSISGPGGDSDASESPSSTTRDRRARGPGFVIESSGLHPHE